MNLVCAETSVCRLLHGHNFLYALRFARDTLEDLSAIDCVKLIKPAVSKFHYIVYSVRIFYIASTALHPTMINSAQRQSEASDYEHHPLPSPAAQQEPSDSS